MRAIGVTLVIAHHMWPWGTQPRVLVSLLDMAWMFMDAFFVMSGFLIAGILLDSRARPDYYKFFFARRALRILPIYYVVLIFITAVAILNGHAAYKNMLTHWGAPWWFFVYLGNIPTAFTGNFPSAGGGAFEPLWSLQVEEQFYLLFPFLVHKLPLRTLARTLLLLCCFSTLLRLVIYWLAPANHLAQYVSLPCRMEGLAIGAWIAIRFRQGPWVVNKRHVLAMVLLSGAIAVCSAALGGFQLTTPLNRTLGFLVSPVFFGFLFFWLIRFPGKMTAWLGTGPLRYIGKISYAAYLLHWPIANAITVILARLRMPWLDVGLSRLVLIYGLTFAVSAISWHFFESPLLRLKDRLFPAVRLQRAA